MKKIRLDAEHLRVESFATDTAGGMRGTVDAHAAAPGGTTRCGTAARGESCYAGCTAEVCEPAWEC